MKKKNKYLPPIPDDIKIKIIDRWRYYPLNSIPQLAEEFNLTESQMHKCINEYLATKIPN